MMWVGKNVRQVDLLVVVLARLGSHDDCLDASGEAAAGSLDDERRGSWKCCGESQSMAVASETGRGKIWKWRREEGKSGRLMLRSKL